MIASACLRSCCPAGIAAMDPDASHLDILLALESRHDDLLHRLDELDQQVQKVLRKWQGPQKARESSPPAGAPLPASPG